MARLNICGFETGDLSEVAIQAGSPTASTTQKRTGAYSLRLNPTSSAVGVLVQGLASTADPAPFGTDGVYIRFYLYIATLPGATRTISKVRNAIANQGTKLEMLSTGAIRMNYINSSFTKVQVGVDSAALATGTWHLIEQQVTGASSGTNYTVACRVNGVSLGSASGLSLASPNPTTIQDFTLGESNDGAASYDLYFDDIAIDDSAYPGPGEVHILKPRAAGSSAQWSTGTSALFSAVNEVPNDGDTSYIKDATSGHVSSFAMDSSATGGVSGTIPVVKTVAIVRDEGGASGVKVRLRNSATSNDTTALDPGSSYVALARLDATNPNGGGSWSTSVLDTIECGVVNNASVAARATAIYAMVECVPATIVTKDVTEDAAISTTDTKDVSEDAVITRTATKDVAEDAIVTTTNTKDVAQDAAITVGVTVTKDVAEDAVVTRTGTKDVSEDAVVTRTVSKDVTQDAAVARTLTKDVAEDAVITRTATKQVDTEAVTNAPAHKDVAEDGAILVTVDLDLPTQGIIGLEATKDVAQDASLYRSVMDVAQDASLSGASVANVLEDAAITKVITKDVAQDASLAQVVSLDLPTLAIIGHEGSYAVTEDAAIARTLTSDVTQDGALTWDNHKDVGQDASLTAVPATVAVHQDAAISVGLTLDVGCDASIYIVGTAPPVGTAVLTRVRPGVATVTKRGPGTATVTRLTPGSGAVDRLPPGTGSVSRLRPGTARFEP